MSAEQLEQVGPSGELYDPTLKPYEYFDPEIDTDALKLAKDKKNFDQALITILAKRSCEQRQEICRLYKAKYGTDLYNDIKSYTRGDFKETLQLLLMDSTQMKAFCCRKAIEGFGTDENCLIQVLCSATNKEILQIREKYHGMFGRDLEKDIAKDTTGWFRKLMIAIVQGCRKEPSIEQIRNIPKMGIPAVVDQERAEQMASILYDAGEKILGTDESKFISILAHESVWQVAAIDSAYSRFSKMTLRNAIKSETSGDFERALLAVLDFSLDRPSAFAKVLKKSMKGLGTDDATLKRIVIARSEVDMNEIKRAYSKLYGVSLADDIKDDTSGNYRDLLLCLIGEES